MFSFTKYSANNQTPDETLLVLSYELGEVIKCHHYFKRYGTTGYKDHGKTEMADVISMVRMYCEQEGWDFYELMDIGEKKYTERMRDLVKNGIKSQLKEELR